MRLLIEDCKYEGTVAQDFIRRLAPRNHDGKVRYVGYLYDKDVEDCVFFLPKVILDNSGKILGKYNPIDVWKDVSEEIQHELGDFLFTFPIWIYQAINIYNHRNPDNRIVKQQYLANADTLDGAHKPFIENLLGLVRFANENKNFLLFKMQHLHGGQTNVNWPKTISHQQPYFRRGKAPIYMEPIVKKKDVDYEEELLAIYFSVLHYINKQYGFSTDINLNFELISSTRFEDYLHGEGTRRLREIRYKYFSDRTLRIWRLCYDFFSSKDRINASTTFEEYLLASDFDRVFEAIVDELIGQPGKTLPKHIHKAQEDGKEIDHLYVYDSLIDKNRKTYYIADSKYYKTEDQKEIGGNSLFKQYTYARNLIQEDLQERIKHPNDWMGFIPCRDEKTEGYNIIPNFFLSAQIDLELSYEEPGINVRNENRSSYHFKNRLFDRETLLLQHYDINFLYVLKLYASNDNGMKEKFRSDIRRRFREELLKRINDDYDFYLLDLKQKTGQSIEQVVDSMFRLLNGKIFCPSVNDENIHLILALSKADDCYEENVQVLSEVDKYFNRTEKGSFRLGNETTE